MARCPECNSRLVIGTDLELWDRVYCDICGTELEIVNKLPLELEVVYDFDDDDSALDELEEDVEDLDWDDDEEEDDDW